MGNFTTGYDSFNRLFLSGNVPDFNSEEYIRDSITDISMMLEFPFGVSYSCYWGFSTLVPPDTPITKNSTVDEKLEDKITLIHEIPTNVFFNMGYMYADAAAIYTLY